MSTPPNAGWGGDPPAAAGPGFAGGRPAAFAITGPPNVAIGAGRGSTQFTITNLTGRPVRARLLPRALQGADQAWIQLAGPSELPLPVAGTVTVDVLVAAPPTAPGGAYLLRLDAVPEDDTESLATGPVAAFTLPPPTVGKKRPWLIPLIIGVVVILIGAGTTIYLLSRPRTPTNQVAPKILGTAPAALGATLSADPGTWKNAGKMSQQWQRCQPTSCLDIAGATGPTYQVVAADLGQSLRLAVTAWQKADGTGPSARVQSDPFPVAAPPHTPVFTPRFPARSSYGPDATYRADIIRVALEGGLIVVSIDVSGREDLRPPPTSCVQVLDASNVQIAALPVNAWEPTLSEPAHYQGDLKFDPGTLPIGNYFLLYSCMPDYTLARIGTVAVP